MSLKTIKAGSPSPPTKESGGVLHPKPYKGL